MPFVYLDTDQVFLDTEEVILGADPEPLGPVGFKVYRNGVFQDILWSRHQLLSISLGISAYDGEIGTGQVTLPGVPSGGNWYIGDRITFVDDGPSDKIIYTGYLMSPRVGINVDSLYEMETTWTLMDMNRQFIGHSIIDDTQTGPFSSLAQSNRIIDMIESTGSPHPTIDDSWVSVSGDVFPTTTWNSDGATDMIAQIISYTGWTVYLSLTDTENEFELHVHALDAGPTSDINIDDTTGAAGGDTFAPSLNSIITYDTTDLKDGITGRNGVDLVITTAAGVVGTGGLAWEATLDFGSLSQADLTTVTNQIASTSTSPRYTFSTNIGPMTGRQVAGMRPGSSIAVNSAYTFPGGRISKETLTVARDSGGNPLKGLWDVALEVGYPLRGPTAFTGFGGQGNQLGALSTFEFWSKTFVIEGDPGIGVGESEAVTAQLQDDNDAAVTVADVSIAWSVVMDDSDTPHPDYDVDITPTLTNATGQATTSVTRTANTTDAKHRVKAEPS